MPKRKVSKDDSANGKYLSEYDYGGEKQRDEIDEYFHQKDYVPFEGDEHSDSSEEKVNEIFPLEYEESGSSESEAEDDEEDVKADASLSDEEELEYKANTDDEFIGIKDWGKSVSQYYNHDLQDFDMLQNDEDAQTVAALEEKEAEAYRSRIFDTQTEDDYIFYANSKSVKKPENNSTISSDSTYPSYRVYQNMSINEKMETVKKRNSEVCMALYLKNKLNTELKLLNEKIEKSVYTDDEKVSKLRKMEKMILTQIIIHINFYLMVAFNVTEGKDMKSSNAKIKEIDASTVKSHPVFGNLNNFMDMYDKICQKKLILDSEETMSTESASFVSYNNEANGDSLTHNIKKHKVSEVMNAIKKQRSHNTNNRKRKVAENNTELNKDSVKEPEGRPITYEMEKNKGLTKKTKKEYRNPRVKHKIKYKKALRARTGQVAPIRQQSSKYDGESRGINSNLVHSVKFK